jgi:hypothetical protein
MHTFLSLYAIDYFSVSECVLRVSGFWHLPIFTQLLDKALTCREMCRYITVRYTRAASYVDLSFKIFSQRILSYSG